MKGAMSGKPERRTIAACFLALALTLSARAQEEPGYTGLPVDPAQPVVVHVLAPAAGAVLADNAVAVQVAVDNYALAPGGNRLRLLLDNHAPQEIDDPAKPISFANLAEGGHLLRLLAVRPDGIALANPEAFALARFSVHRRDFRNLPTEPYLTLNLPLNGPVIPDAEGRVWLDFKVAGGALAPDGYRVRARLDRLEKTLFTDAPTPWTNLAPGRYHLTVDLLDARGQPVPGVFNQAARVFDIDVPVKAIPLGPPPAAH
jgi:hypothetical protein